MTARNAASVALAIALGLVVVGAIGRTSHDLLLLAVGIVGVLAGGIWRLRL